MKAPFKNNFLTLKRFLYATAAAVLFAASLPFLYAGNVYAVASQLGARSIQMSDSSVSGGSIASGVGSGTSVVYEVSIVTNQTADSIAIDFCTQDPIIGDTCTKPTGLTLTTTVAAPSPFTGSPGPMSGWTPTLTSHGIELADGSSESNAASAGTQVFDLKGITNTSTLGSFYARIYTFTHHDFESTGGTPYAGNPTAPGNYANYGGIAMSTTKAITITARVQETLTFCVTSEDPNSWANTTPNNPSGSAGDCSAGEVGANAPAVTLGSGSPTPVLTANTVDVGNSIGASSDNPIFSQLSTNATNGAVVDLRNSNTSCGGLSADSGSTCAIPAVSSLGGACTPTTACAITAGVAAFGLFVNQYIPTSSIGTVGTITSQQPYYNSGHCGPNTAANPCPAGDGSTWFGMDSTTTPTNGGSPSTNIGNDTSTFGSIVAKSTAPVYHFDDQYEFAATAALTTPAGIYTANLSLIATGSF